MQNEEHTCIKYLMKELDPSEAVLFERKMMEDDDLLIEVECMRKTLRRLDNLPEVDPPAHLTDMIVHKAAARKSSPSHTIIPFNSQQSQTKYYAAAAILAVGVTFGVLSLESGLNQEKKQPNSSMTAEVQSRNVQNRDVGRSSVKPWVDRNNVLYFTGTSSSINSNATNTSASAYMDSALEESMKKLKPIDEPLHFYNKTNAQEFQLTGTKN